MRNHFRGFYRPTKEEFEELWNNGTIILDANVILNLYRLPEETRSQFFKLLETVKDRLWLPHQVALEFQRNRISAIQEEHKSLNDSRLLIEKSFSAIVKKIDDMDFSKQKVDIDVNKIIEGLNIYYSELSKGIDDLGANLQEISLEDDIRDRIDEIFYDVVGPAIQSQADLETIYTEGKLRFDNSIPPGFEDKGKDRSDYYNNLIIKSKFGDLIIWKQIIAHALSTNLKSVLFITDDKKRDWWSKPTETTTVGPRPELIHEIQSQAKVENFWMYTSKSFAKFANDYLKAGFSQTSLDEISIVSNETDEKFHNELRDELWRPSWQRIADVDAIGWASFGADSIVQAESDQLIFKKSGQIILAKKIPMPRSNDAGESASQILGFIHTTDITYADRAIFLIDVGVDETYTSVASNIVSISEFFVEPLKRKKIEVVFGRSITRMGTFVPLLCIRELATLELGSLPTRG